MTWTRVGLGLLGLLAAALIYPGIPVGAPAVTRSSPAGAQTDMECYSLHWNGLRHKHVTVRQDATVTRDADGATHSSTHGTNAACWLPPY